MSDYRKQTAFAEWLIASEGYSFKVASDHSSRLNRISKLFNSRAWNKKRPEANLRLHEKIDANNTLTMSVKSQLKRVVTLYIKYLDQL
jgi:hypothetical protein